MSCSLRDVYRRFGETYHFHLQGIRESEARNQQEASDNQLTLSLSLSACSLLLVDCLTYLDTKEGGSILLRNIDKLLPDSSAVHPRK
jgi:hypothetical protein